MDIQKALLLIFILFISACSLSGQNAKGDIQGLRKASNAAIQNNDLAKVLSFLTEDVLITTGHGNLIVGKEALREYLSRGDMDNFYWIRTPREIEVNEERGLAWESGTWRIFDREGDKELKTGGKYSAMWTRESGNWLIKSQLFVTLE